MSENLRPTAAQDAATQASAGSEARVRGTDQDSASTGAADAASGQETLRAGIANQPGTGSEFTKG